MRKFYKNNKKAVILFITFIFIFPIVILCPSPIGMIPREIGSIIVGYGGTILGGFLTLYGVWWTIEDNRSSRKEELELQYCPILSAEIVEKTAPVYQLCSEIMILFQHPHFDDADLWYPDYLIKICNVGRGEIRRTQLHLNECSVISTFPHKLENEIDLGGSYLLLDGVFNFIPINGACYLYVGMPILKKEYTLKMGEKEYTYIRFDVSISITIDGVFSSKEQEYLLHFFVDMKFKKYLKECRFDSLMFMKN